MTRARDVSTPTALVLLNTTTFSAQSSVSFDNVFSSAYDNYRIIAAHTSTVSGSETRIRLRASGADNTNSNYASMNQRLGENGTSYNLTGYTSYAPINNNNANTNSLSFDVISPNKAADTNFSGTAVGVMNTGSFNAAGVIGVKFDLDTVFDGFTIYFSSGTITGTIKVYGYK